MEMSTLLHCDTVATFSRQPASGAPTQNQLALLLFSHYKFVEDLIFLESVLELWLP